MFDYSNEIIFFGIKVSSVSLEEQTVGVEKRR
jgi:hypothetical protein